MPSGLGWRSARSIRLNYFRTEQEYAIMTHWPEDQKTTVRQPVRRSYHKPRLFIYGAVRNLTAGGSGKASENNQGGVKPRS